MRPTKKSIRKALLALSLYPFYLTLLAQAPNELSTMSLLDRMQQDEMPYLEITTNINALFADWRVQNYHWGNAKLSFSDGEEIEEDVSLKIRGKYRSKNCKNPPIKLKYSNKSLKLQNFKKLNEFKLVYPCKSNKDYQKFVWKEYLIYKLYNELTDYSFRVQLLDLGLTDSLSRKSDYQFKGFLIEDQEELIYRMGALTGDGKCLSPDNLDQRQYTIFQLFQFLIGNTDWVLPSCKNVEVVALPNGEVIPVPYDFDFSGMVNASYATGDAGLGLNHVTQRYFIGPRKSMEELAPILQLFKEKRERFTQIIQDFEYLPIKDRKKMVKYLNSFYRILNRPKRVKRIFVHPKGGAKNKS